MLDKLKRAVLRTILFFAFIHILILVYLAFTTNNFTFINIFSILDLQEFYPGIEIGTKSALISVIIVSAIFIINYKRKK